MSQHNQPPRSEIEAVLEKLATQKLLGRRIRIEDRKRSPQDLADLEMTGTQRDEIIYALEVSDFSHCQPGDAGFGNVYVFGSDYKKIELYIKLGDVDKTQITCVSFHKAKRPLEYPYRDTDNPST